MLNKVALLEIVFRWSIFGLLAYKLSALTRSHLLPFLYQQITDERKHNEELLEKDKLLVSTRHRIENQIFNQRQRFILLEKNMQIWHRQHIEQNDLLARENRLIVEAIKEKRLTQKKYISLYNSINLTLNQALEGARQELNMLAENDSGVHILRKTIDTLPSNTANNIKI